jgi:hypothetical protein
METLHEEAFYEGKFDPDEVRYSIEKIKRIIDELENEVQNKAVP